MKSLRRLILEARIEQPDGFYLTEGLDIEYRNGYRYISYNPIHQNLINTSEEDNPTTDNAVIPGIPVYSVFTRNHIGNNGRYIRNDGNPLVYAFKGEMGCRFKSQKDKDAIIGQIKKILNKFIADHSYDVTVLIPTRSFLNRFIADLYQSIDGRIKIIEGLLSKMTTDEVYDEVYKNKRFLRFIENHEDEENEFLDDLDRMDAEHDGYFAFHMVSNKTIRNLINKTLKYSDNLKMYKNGQIEGRNVLIIDDVISRGKTLKEAVELIQEEFTPKSVSILTMFSNAK